MPLTHALYVLLFGNISSQTTGTFLIKDMYQCEYCTTSDSSTFSPLLDAALLQYVASHCVACIVVLTAHQKLSIGVTVRLMIV